MYENISEGLGNKDVLSILETLVQTDNKIVDLQQFSSNDFSLLNQKFLTFHRHSNEFSRKVIDFTKLLWSTSDEKGPCLKRHLTFFIKIGTQAKLAIDKLTDLVEHLSNINSSICYVLVPLNNFKQNLYTLKLLSANLKIDKTLSVNNKSLYKQIDDLIIILDNICLYCPKIDSHLDEYQNKTEEVYNKLSAYLNNILIPYNIALTELTALSQKYIMSLDEMSELEKKIEEAIKSNLQNVETIITKLQYQDIIRQRIEHIQETHRDLIERIKNIPVDKNDIQTKNSFRDQVKDVVGLQAAHLIHINQEFQNAIETISDTIQGYNSNISKFNETTDKITESFIDTDKILGPSFEKFYLKISKLTDNEKESSNVSQLVADINNSFIQLTDYFDEIKQLSDKLDKINASIKKVNKQKTIAKIEGLLFENQKHAEKIQKQFQILSSQGKSCEKYNTEFLGNNNSFFNQISLINKNQVIEIIKKITDDIPGIKKDLTNNSNEQNDLNNALQQMQYYIYFEQNINHIVNLLDELNSFFENAVEPVTDTRKNIEHIKRIYTTTSEHVVHNKYSDISGNNIDELIANLEKKYDDAENDNIEFF